MQTNVVPEKLIAIFDLRLPPTVDHDEIEKMINGWCKEAGDGVHITFQQKNPKVESTKLDATNPFWTAFKSTCDKIGVSLEIGVFPGGTDSRYIRSVRPNSMQILSRLANHRYKSQITH